MTPTRITIDHGEGEAEQVALVVEYVEGDVEIRGLVPAGPRFSARLAEVLDRAQRREEGA